MFREIGDARGPIAVPTTGVTVGSLSLPAGSYVVFASLDITNPGPSDGIAGCLLLLNNQRNAQAFVPVPANGAVNEALTVADSFSTIATADLKCRNNVLGSGQLSIQTFNLNAIKVGTLTFQN